MHPSIKMSIMKLNAVTRSTCILFQAVYTWTLLTFHNTWGILNVFFITWVRPMKGGAIAADHPLATGIDPKTQKFVWHDNVIFKTEPDQEYIHTDDEIIEIVGKTMAKMVTKSSSDEINPEGVPDRLPPAINYIHAGVHYNGGFLLFNNTKEAIKYFSNKDFQNDFKKFVKEEKREPVTIFRDRNYDRMEYLQFVCFLRTIFPWFSNSNGNKKRIGWGNPAPYRIVNTITGHWKTDTYKFYDPSKIDSILMDPIPQGKYFQKSEYPATRETTTFAENWLADFTNNRILSRGDKGNMFFIDNRKLKKGYKYNPEALPGLKDVFAERLGLYSY